MHAASVHPEPGSNSRKFVLYRSFKRYNHFRAFVALFTFFELYFSFELSRFYFALFVCFVLISCCSIFNDRLPSLKSCFRFLSRRLDYYITSLSPCQVLFQNFFEFFYSFFRNAFPCVPSQTAFTLYYLSSLLSRGFLKLFSKNIIFFQNEYYVYRMHRKEHHYADR